MKEVSIKSLKNSNLLTKRSFVLVQLCMIVPSSLPPFSLHVVETFIFPTLNLASLVLVLVPTSLLSSSCNHKYLEHRKKSSILAFK